MGIHNRKLRKIVTMLANKLFCQDHFAIAISTTGFNSLDTAFIFKSGLDGRLTVHIPRITMNDINLTEFRTHDKDTGSADYQVALLTKRILHLTEHLKIHKKDSSSKRGLLKMVAVRRKLLSYIKKQDVDRYTNLIKGLGLRK